MDQLIRHKNIALAVIEAVYNCYDDAAGIYQNISAETTRNYLSSSS